MCSGQSNGLSSHRCLTANKHTHLCHTISYNLTSMARQPEVTWHILPQITIIIHSIAHTSDYHQHWWLTSIHRWKTIDSAEHGSNCQQKMSLSTSSSSLRMIFKNQPVKKKLLQNAQCLNYDLNINNNDRSQCARTATSRKAQIECTQMPSDWLS